MHSHAFDRYHHGQSPLHSLDPRIKVIITFAFILSNALLPEILTKVRWRKGNLYGLVFDTTFQFAELARTVAVAQGLAIDKQSF